MSKLVENYLLQEPVGKGVYGKVYRALHQRTKQEYAVKVIPKSIFQANPKLEQLAINEIKILSSLRNDHIVKFVETLKTPNNFYFVYEFCNGGALDSLLEKRKFLPEKEALNYFAQLLDAFKELNKNNVMHRDLKPDNIFLSDGMIKLGDFGFCKMLEVNMAQTMLGSPIYMAPEILKEEIYTSKADIWSLGVVLFQMLFGYCPFESSSISQLINVLKETELVIPEDVNQISETTRELLKKMLIKDQFKRIEWVDLFQYRLDEDGRMTCPVKRDYSHIESLENYFLFNKTSGPYVSQKEIKEADSPKRRTESYEQHSEKISSTNSNQGGTKEYENPIILTQTQTITSFNPKLGATTTYGQISKEEIPSVNFSSTMPPTLQRSENFTSTTTRTYGAYTYNKLSSPTAHNTDTNGHGAIKITTNAYNPVVSPTSNKNIDSMNQFPSLSNLGHSQRIGNPNLENSRNRNNEQDRQRETSNFSNASSSTNLRKTADENQESTQKMIPTQLVHQHSNYSISNYPEPQPELKHAISASPKKFYSLNRTSASKNAKSELTFEARHEEWTKALEIMDDLSRGQKETSEIFIYWLLVTLSRRINTEAIYHPEWTDVILEERKAVNEALKEMNSIDPKFKDPHTNHSLGDGKNQILKLWKKGSGNEIKNNIELYEQAVRLMYGNESNTGYTPEQILLT